MHFAILHRYRWGGTARFAAAQPADGRPGVTTISGVSVVDVSEFGHNPGAPHNMDRVPLNGHLRQAREPVAMRHSLFRRPGVTTVIASPIDDVIPTPIHDMDPVAIQIHRRLTRLIRTRSQLLDRCEPRLGSRCRRNDPERREGQGENQNQPRRKPPCNDQPSQPSRLTHHSTPPARCQRYTPDHRVAVDSRFSPAEGGAAPVIRFKCGYRGSGFRW